MPGRGLSQLSQRNIRGMFYEEFEASKKIGWVDALANMFNSDQDYETYRWLSMSPMLRQWLNGRQSQAWSVNGIMIENLPFEATIEFMTYELRRDKTQQIRIRMGDLVDRSQTHWAQLLSQLVMLGNSTPCYDGQNFFSASHVEGDSGTHSNFLTQSDYSELNVAVPTDPTASELADALMRVLQHFYTYKDAVNQPRNENALEFLLMVPVNMFGAAQTAVRSKLLNTGTGSRDNPLAVSDFNVQVAANPRITWSTDFAVFRTDARVKPFIRQSEQEVDLKILGPGSDLEFTHNKWQVGIDAYRNVGYGMWWQAIRATLS